MTPVSTPFEKLTSLFKAANYSYLRLLLPLSIALLGGLFDGATMAMLVPTLQLLGDNEVGLQTLPRMYRLVQYLLPGAINEHPSVLLGLLGALCLLFSILKSACQSLSRGLIGYRLLELENSVRSYYAERLLSLSPYFYETSSRAAPLQALTGYMIQMTNSLTVVLQGAANSFHVIFYFMLLTWISWKLTLATLVLIPFLLKLHRLVVARASSARAQQIAIKSKLDRAVKHILDNYVVIFALNTAKDEHHRIQSISDELTRESRGLVRKHVTLPLINDLFVLTVVAVICLAIATLSYFSETTSVAGYGIYLLTLQRTSRYLSSLSSIRLELNLLAPFIDFLEASIPHTFRDPVVTGDTSISSFHSDISFQKVHLAYPGEIMALKDVSFTIPANKITAIVGTSGSGKSTLVKLLLRFMDPSAGTISIDGRPLPEYVIADWRSMIAVVTQDSHLLHDTLRANLNYGLNYIPSTDELIAALDQAQLLPLLHHLPHGLEQLIGEHGVTLSGGERQRVSIARAFLRAPKILILDEATSALDSNTEELVHKALSNLMNGRTSIIIAHRLSTIASADQIVCLQKGEVIETGKLDDLLSKKGLFHSLWTKQHLESRIEQEYLG
jgi:ABC-type multidrug transport system fused ATPase/permease subunit